MIFIMNDQYKLSSCIMYASSNRRPYGFMWVHSKPSTVTRQAHTNRLTCFCLIQKKLHLVGQLWKQSLSMLDTLVYRLQARLGDGPVISTQNYDGHIDGCIVMLFGSVIGYLFRRVEYKRVHTSVVDTTNGVYPPNRRIPFS